MVAEMRVTGITTMKLTYTPPRAIEFQSIFPQSVFPDRSNSKKLISEIYFDGYYIGHVEKPVIDDNVSWEVFNGFSVTAKPHYRVETTEPYHGRTRFDTIKAAAKQCCLRHLEHHRD